LEFVDFTELPPARGLCSQLTQFKVTRRSCPTCTLGCSVYASVLALKFPQHLPELLAYSRDIVRASPQFKWSSWVIHVYDINYCRHMADIGQHDWSRVDPSIYARCFTGWVRSPSWCTICVTLDHNTSECPFAPMQDRRTRRSLPYPPYTLSSAAQRSSLLSNLTTIP
jgi:hypothetical protein